MKKLVVLVILSVLVLTGFGCSKSADPFISVDDDIRNGLVSFLESAALGGRGQYVISVEGDIGEKYVGEIQGSVADAPAGSEIVYFSTLGNSLVEVSRSEVQGDGNWGPITVLYGPKVLVLIGENGVEEVLGYWLSPHMFAVPPLSAMTEYQDLYISPRDSGLVALALIHSGKLQEAANLLASIKELHIQYEGLPKVVDVFGIVWDETVDAEATAWAGYAAAVLARTTNNSKLWDEARRYGLNLQDMAIPDELELRAAGSLLFSELASKYPEFSPLAEQWQPEADRYHPLMGTWMLVSGNGSISKYADFDYQPESEREKWLHYNVLAALNKLPEDLGLDGINSFPGGIAWADSEGISLEVTSWIVLTLSGGIRD